MYSGLMQVCGEKIQEVLFVVLVEQKSSLVWKYRHLNINTNFRALWWETDNPWLVT
jgi:hypothetical protein